MIIMYISGTWNPMPIAHCHLEIINGSPLDFQEYAECPREGKTIACNEGKEADGRREKAPMGAGII